MVIVVKQFGGGTDEARFQVQESSLSLPQDKLLSLLLLLLLLSLLSMLLSLLSMLLSLLSLLLLSRTLLPLAHMSSMEPMYLTDAGSMVKVTLDPAQAHRTPICFDTYHATTKKNIPRRSIGVNEVGILGLGTIEIRPGWRRIKVGYL